MTKSREFNELYEYAELSESSELERMQKKYSHWMVSKRFSTNSIKNDGYILSRFIAWCHERGIFKPQEVTRDILEHYQGQISRRVKENGETYSSGYLSAILTTIRGFFKWLAKRHHILYNPASELELPRMVKHIPRNVMSTAEVEAVMMQVDLSSRFGLRDRAILEVLYSTGIRRLELCQLSCKDVFMDSGVMLIREGKGRKDRMVPIGERALAWVEKYKNDLRPALARQGEEALFLNSWGNPITPARMSDLVSNYIKSSGIEKEGSCHMFRHTMATLMLEGGADIRYIQQILGHSKLDTTQIYTHVSIKKLKEVHCTTHPAALLQPNPTKLI
jgi:integrase/recombinase XerD